MRKAWQTLTTKKDKENPVRQLLEAGAPSTFRLPFFLVTLSPRGLRQPLCLTSTPRGLGNGGRFEDCELKTQQRRGLMTKSSK